jgi:ribosomal protein S18 acetylase RimI-like enzyme
MNAENQVRTRVASVADSAALAQLSAATFSETFGLMYQARDLAAFLADSRSEEVYAKLLRDPQAHVRLAVLDAKPEPVGYIVVGPCKLPVANLEPTAGEVRELYVLSEYQKHKLGTLLMAEGLQWLQSQRCTPLYVGVYSENLGAQRLYARFGFNRVGEYDFPVGEHIDREFILKR